MHFHKYPYASNFEFVSSYTARRSFRTSQGSFQLNASASTQDIYHVSVSGKGWEQNEAQIKLRLPKPKDKLEGERTRMSISADGAFSLETLDGRALLGSNPGRFFGQCGEASIFEFQREHDDRFYGMGEKWSGFEHSDKTHKFWNTDIWGDFNPASYIDGKPAPDPAYVAIPYLILKRGQDYIGLLLDNPHATFISTAAKLSIAGQMELAGGGNSIQLGAECGQPSLYIIYGPSLPELTRKFQQFVGTTPLPPAWSLGYQQCRWGYMSEKDLVGLDREFTRHGIPVDGLWLDIEYMRGYRVFTFDAKHFPDPQKAAAKLAKKGRKIVPIIDPGVKHEPGYDVYERGHAAKAFCLNQQGGEYIGLVWPGETAFPDYSMKSARKWWAKEVADFASLGIVGAWLDMNDPSTGKSDNAQMLFNKGQKPHTSYHNQYALGMAMASREGFLDAHPEQRPFLLSRSGCTGSQRFTAIWTGDNYSNYHHLRNSIATTLNLALSGIPFNGPDAGGFGGDTTPELISDWFKAGFLFPFLRNHSIAHSRQQEPWAFDAKTLRTLTRYIRLRYRFRPYLYQLFIAQEKDGEAILRPLFYDFESTEKLPLDKVDDQFMVGPSVMQAPFLDEGLKQRNVTLPGEERWFDVSAAKWTKGGRTLRAKAAQDATPLYIREGSILPLARLAPEDHAFIAARVDFHIFLSRSGKTMTSYAFDDGESFAYKKGKRSVVEISAERKGRSLAIDLRYKKQGFGQGDFTFTTESAIESVTVNGVAATRCKPQGEPVCKGLVTWSV